jgi:hypothetical protein
VTSGSSQTLYDFPWHLGNGVEPACASVCPLFVHADGRPQCPSWIARSETRAESTPGRREYINYISKICQKPIAPLDGHYPIAFVQSGMGNSSSTNKRSEISSTNPSSIASSKILSDLKTCCSCQSEDVPRRNINPSKRKSKGSVDVAPLPSPRPSSVVPAVPASPRGSPGRFSVYLPTTTGKVLPGWSQEERLAFENAIKTTPRHFSSRNCRKGDPDFATWMEKVCKKVPGKTAEQCSAFYLDMISNRIAFFSPANQGQDVKISKIGV